MSDFDAILARATARKGGPAALEELLDAHRAPAADPRDVPDDRWLSRMAKHIMAAGFRWRIVEAMWPAHEEHLFGFEPEPVAFMSDADIDRVADTKGVIGHRGKLSAIRDNARMIVDVAADHGSFGAFVAEWPDEDPVGLFLWLKAHGNRLGGMTGPYMLRAMGVDTFLFTKDVGAALVEAGIVDKAPATKKRMQQAQDAFVRWRGETGRSFTDLSRILAYSTGEQYD